MYELITQIEIDSSPEKIWQALTDFESYPQWNPSIRSIVGKPVTGAKIKVTYNPRDSFVKMKFTVEITNCERDREFRWLGLFVFPALFAGDHYMTIEPVTDGRSRLIHGELFSGLLKPVVWFLLAKLNKRAFEEMNQALKDYVEKAKLDAVRN